MSDQFLSICCSCVCISTLLQCWNFLRNIRSALVLCVILLLDFQFLCLPKYNYEMEYLPASKGDREGKFSADREVVDMSELYTDIMRRSSKDSIPRASSLSSIDSIMTPSRMSGEIWIQPAVVPMLALNHLTMCVAQIRKRNAYHLEGAM